MPLKISFQCHSLPVTQRNCGSLHIFMFSMIETMMPRLISLLSPPNLQVAPPNKRVKASATCWHVLLILLRVFITSSVQFSHSVVSESLRLYGRQHTRLPCPSPAPRACSNSCPLSQWCHPIIPSSVVPFSCLQSCPASGFFQWVSSLHQVAKVLELQQQFFQWTFRIDFF